MKKSQHEESQDLEIELTVEGQKASSIGEHTCEVKKKFNCFKEMFHE